MSEHITADDVLADALIGTTVDYMADQWSSDWIGYEVGFDNLSVVGLYSVPDSSILYYVDTENGYVLDAWSNED